MKLRKEGNQQENIVLSVDGQRFLNSVYYGLGSKHCQTVLMAQVLFLSAERPADHSAEQPADHSAALWGGSSVHSQARSSAVGLNKLNNGHIRGRCSNRCNNQNSLI